MRVTRFSAAMNDGLAVCLELAEESRADISDVVEGRG